MSPVKPKKHLGQHFLKDRNIARKIVAALPEAALEGRILEIGPGTGILTDILTEKSPEELILIEVDRESVLFLKNRFQHKKNIRLLEGDFLKIDLDGLLTRPTAVIGNFPYNISSQIFFHILKYHDRIPVVVCMLQREVAERICSREGSRVYGILSVLLGAWYDREILFRVPAQVFHPPPKVESAVIRLTRNKMKKMPCDLALFEKIVKQGFQNRRKTLRNALKRVNLPVELADDPLLSKRAEQLTAEDFILLTQKAETHWNSR